MEESWDRKWRLEQLLYKQKLKQIIDYGILFDECVGALGEGLTILSKEKSKETYDFSKNPIHFPRGLGSIGRM